jgi:uncharacterized membrane protein YkvA (DUF1232 family)
MSEIPSLQGFVSSLPDDVREVLAFAEDRAVPRLMRRQAVAALNYVLVNLDVIPDWVPVIGLYDDAAVLRVVMAELGEQDQPELPLERMATVARLANQADEVRDLLGADRYAALRQHIGGFAENPAKGRRPDSILADERTFERWKRDVIGLLKDLRCELRSPADPSELQREIRSYFDAKLRARR